MSNAAQRNGKETLSGDTAVNGLIAGILAGLGMAAYLVLVSVISGESPAIMLGRFDPALEGRWLVGVLAHLAVSGIYGAVFALLLAAIGRIRPSLWRYGWLLGILYGLVLLVMANSVLLPMAGSPLMQIAFPHLLIGHVIYGLILGFELSRK